MARMRIELHEAGGAKLPVGPLTKVTDWQYGDAVGTPGAFSFSYPASDRKCAAIEKGRYARLYVVGEGYVFQGKIEKVTASTSAKGDRMVQASGRGAAVELIALKTKGATFNETGTIAAAVSSLVTGTSWAAGQLGTPSLSTYSRGFFGVSKFEALNKLAELFGWLVRFDGRTRTLDLHALGEASGLRLGAMEGPVPQGLANNPKFVPLANLALTEDIAEVVTRVIPFGQEQGISGDRVTLELATVTSPYTVQSAVGDDGETYWYLVDGAAESAAGGVTEEYVTFQDIVPASTASADRIRAANALHGAASTYLRRRKDAFRSLVVQPALMKHIRNGADTFRVGQTVRVTFDGWVKDRTGRREWLAVDEDLYVMGYTRRSAGEKDAWALQVSSSPRRAPDSTQALVEMYQSFQASLTTPRPMFTWGGVPPVGRLTPDGVQLVSMTGAYATEIERKIQWMTSDFASRHAEVYGAREEDLDTNYLIGKVFKDVDAQAIYGIRNAADTAWDMAMYLTQSDGGDVSKFSIRAGLNTLLSLEEAVSGYKLYRYNGTSLAEVGGMLKAANTGPFLIPASGVGNWVQSGAANAFGSWYPLPFTEAAVPTSVTETASATAVAMPATVEAGDLLIAFVSTTTTAQSTPGGWTQLGKTTNAVELGVYYKVAAGNEDGTTVNFGGTGCAQVFRILAANFIGTPQISTVATGTSVGSNATAVTPTAGRFLSIAVCATTNSATIDSSPSGYSTVDTATNSTVLMGTGYVQDSGSSEDPGAFTLSIAQPWVTFVVAVAAPNAVKEDTYITDMSVEISGTPNYAIVQLATGAAGAESIIGTYKLTPSDWTLNLPAIIPVSAAALLSARMMTSAAAAAHFLTLGMLNQDDAA